VLNSELGDAASLALERGGRASPVQTEILGEMAEPIEVGSGVATHSKNIIGRRDSPPENQIAMFACHLVHEGRVKWVVGHSMIQFHPKVKNPSLICHLVEPVLDSHGNPVLCL
jgi:hypothetical protein